MDPKAPIARTSLLGKLGFPTTVTPVVWVLLLGQSQADLGILLERTLDSLPQNSAEHAPP